MGGMSPIHWIIVLAVVLLIFGTKKLRNIGSDMGAAVKGFKDGMKDGDASKETPQATQQVAQSTTTQTATLLPKGYSVYYTNTTFTPTGYFYIDGSSCIVGNTIQIANTSNQTLRSIFFACQCQLRR